MISISMLSMNQVSVVMSSSNGLMMYCATMVKNWLIPQSMLVPHTLITSAVRVCSVIAFPRCVTGAAKTMDQYNQSELTVELIGACVTYAPC